VFPNAQNLPPKSFEGPANLLVTLLISLNLCGPELRVGLRDSAMLRAAVPEAPIDEDCDAQP
jgi:hypothetical protein